ncbi:MAG: NAD-dependent protein deacetylase [Clostridia bacterium]|nr:NAD-dependent protein deacetylase [Clostridia bacterium]
MKSEYAKLKEYMDAGGKTVAVTGAGISYLYGMRRLKKSVGLMNARRVFSADYVNKNPEKFYEIIKDAFLDATFVKGPSKAHRQLAELERQGKLYGVVTQNMDCLHTIAGSKNVAEFQGSFGDNICTGCKTRYYDYNIWNHGHMPRCEKCGSPVMPSSFAGGDTGEAMAKAIDMIAEADLVIVIGTTGFRSGEYLSKMKKSTKLIQINPSSTEFDGLADLNIRADAAEALDAVLNG